MEQYREHSPQTERILQAMSQAAFLLDRQGGVCHANPAAEALLQSGDGLHCQNRQLTAALPEEQPALAHWIEGALSVAAGATGTYEPLRLRRLSKKPGLVMMLIPLPLPASSIGKLFDHALLLLVIDPVSRSMAATSTVERAFGLTHAEARVAVLVGAGSSAPQAAVALGLSLTTVKTHLARIFEKIGVNSQVALAKLFAALPFDPASSNEVPE